MVEDNIQDLTAVITDYPDLRERFVDYRKVCPEVWDGPFLRLLAIADGRLWNESLAKRLCRNSPPNGEYGDLR